MTLNTNEKVSKPKPPIKCFIHVYTCIYWVYVQDKMQNAVLDRGVRNSFMGILRLDRVSCSHILLYKVQTSKGLN